MSLEKVIDRDTARELLFEMVRMRRFEEKCIEMYQASKIRGFLHVYIGEEAVAAGVLGNIDSQDSVVSTYREHGHALVRGVSSCSIMAEMYGKQEGCSLGRGGSMHLFDKSHRFYGGNAIVGGGLPLAVGLALADKMQQRSSVTVCFFGEGASAEGAFHESMNLAALWKVPVLFVCENNLYAMGTPIAVELAQPKVFRMAESYGIASSTVDGMDVLAVRKEAHLALEYVRQGHPYLLECQTYRFRPHSMFDAELYRTKQEVERWKKRDPIEKFFEQACEAQILLPNDRTEVESVVGAEIERAVQFAEEGTWEDPKTLHRFVYSEGD
jgi:pyruvate dehydrogenase E1 component alpha subunit/2-oxoisovalerate dehydrogenase E1 component